MLNIPAVYNDDGSVKNAASVLPIQLLTKGVLWDIPFCGVDVSFADDEPDLRSTRY